MSSTIYQDIWDADQDTNGVRAICPHDVKPSSGYAVVDEPTTAGEEHHVIAEVVIPPEKNQTYELCEKLFNNYTLDPAIREDVTFEETREEQNFIDAILPLPPIQVAKAFMESEQGSAISDSNLAAMIKETWFAQGMAGSKTASGFEHVFVGEQSAKGELPDTQAAKMGGYHYWHKYFLDDGAGLLSDGDDRIIYQGGRYGGGDRADGRLVPEIVTMRFRWNAMDFATGRDQLLSKSIGGFWVGCSPEGLIALGLIRVRTRAGNMAVINGSTYQLDFHALDNNRHGIRTFFPRFIKTELKDLCPEDHDQDRDGTSGGGGGSGNGQPGPGGGPPNDPNPAPGPGGLGERPNGAEANGNLRIIAALVNTSGNEVGRETVTLINAGPESINLEDWSIRAPNGWRFTIGDVTLPSGETHRFRMTSPQPQFRNKGGAIALLSPDGKVQQEAKYDKDQGSKEDHTIIF